MPEMTPVVELMVNPAGRPVAVHVVKLLAGALVACMGKLTDAPCKA
jgi:hypothetical protein